MRLLLWLVLLSVPSVLWAGVEPLQLGDRTDRVNYSLGYHLGRQLEEHGLPFHPDLLWQALYEGVNGVEKKNGAGEEYLLANALGMSIAEKSLVFRARPLWQGLYDHVDQVQPLVIQAEMEQLLHEFDPLRFGKKPVTNAPSKETKPVEPPKGYRLPGQRFLVENEDREGVVTLPSGLQYRIIATGEGKQPGAEALVLVNYEARTIDNKRFSSSLPLGVPKMEEVRVNEVIRGWTEALQLMHEGDRWELFVPAQLAYRDVGPLAGQTIIYDLELVEVLEQAP